MLLAVAQGNSVQGTNSLMHTPNATTTLPVRSADSYPDLMSSVKASALTPAAAPEEAYKSIRRWPCFRPVLPCDDTLAEVKFLIVERARTGLFRPNWLLQAEQVHGRGPMRVAREVEMVKAFIWKLWLLLSWINGS